MMKLRNENPKRLKPDKNQPRKYIDEEKVKAMTVSIKNEGIINPIEVDKHMIIITGEMRWRASMLANLKRVPVKVIYKITPQERFLRQLHENVHNNTMSPWDTAKAYEKAVKILGDAKRTGNLLGVDPILIRQMIKLSGTGKDAEKILRTSTSWTKLRAITTAPEEYIPRLRKLLIKQPTIRREAVTALKDALKRAKEYKEEKKAEKLFKINYSNLSIIEAVDKINKIIPTEEARMDEPHQVVEVIGKKMYELVELMENYPLWGFPAIHQVMVKGNVLTTVAFFKNYLTEKKKLSKGK